MVAIILYDLLTFSEIFLSPQVKWSVIIFNKSGKCVLFLEMPNDLKHKILGNWEISGKSQSCTMLQPTAQSSSQIENSINSS